MKTKESCNVRNAGNEVFPRINPAVIVAVSHGDELILTKYAAGNIKNMH